MCVCVHVCVCTCACVPGLLSDSFPFLLTENFTPVDVPEPQVPELPYEVPPYEGFQIGSQEDSLANCLNLIPKPPKRDFIKFMEKDRYSVCVGGGVVSFIKD